LISPAFLFRSEQPPQGAGPVHRISDLDLASRLSFFLWSSIPDDELLDLAAKGRSRIRRCSNARCAGCSPTIGRQRW
jgi:hypothetical protein